jgi:signal transduction histidine kinase
MTLDATLLRRPRALLLTEALIVVLGIGFTLPDSGVIGIALLAVPTLVYGWLGARIAERAPENRVGWLLSAASVTAALAVAGTAYHSFDQTHAVSPLPFSRGIHVLVETLPFPMIGVFLLIAFLSFPDGRLPSPRWRAVVWLLVAIGVAGSIVLLGNSLVAVGLNPLWARTWLLASPFPDLVVTTAGAGFLLTVASLAVRSRRASPEERRPIRGLLVSLLLMAATLPLFAFFAADDNWIIVFPAFALLVLGVLVLIPFSLSVAMLRYGLFEYELGIKKTLARHLLVVVIVLLAALLSFLLGSTIAGVFLAGGQDQRLGPVIATAFGGLFGILFTLVVIWGRRFADRVVFRERATPYEVLSQFSGRVGETFSLNDVLPRMSLILANGTGASIVRVWLAVDGDLRPIAAHPEDAPPAEPIQRSGDDLAGTGDGSRHAFAVRHQGELLGAIDVTMPANDPMNEQKERLARDLAGQAGLVLRNVGLLEDVRESRRRIVAAQDERARALERNIHDGAQQQLVALTVKLRLAEQLVDRDPIQIREMLTTLQADAAGALADLRDLARGIYPPLLADKGLGAALEAQARKCPVPVTVASDGLGRFSQDIEAAIYFSCLEALQNITKYAEASRVEISLTRSSNGRLSFAVTDDGVGFDPASASHGSGLQGIADRLDALGGTLEIVSTVGVGTAVNGSVPVL